MTEEIGGKEDPNVSAMPKDYFIDTWFKLLGDLGSGIPDAYRIWSMGRAYLDIGDVARAKKCETLNYLLHNSIVPYETWIDDGVRFGYGGVGVVLHKDSEIGKQVTIEAGVVLGGGNVGRNRINRNGVRVGAPKIDDYVYLSVGAKILGGVTIGKLSVVGANAVVRDSVPPLSVVVGIPARVSKRITMENCLRYKSMFTPLRGLSDAEFVAMVAGIGEHVPPLD